MANFNFKEYEGEIDGDFYKFPPLFSKDANQNLREWQVLGRLIKDNDKKVYSAGWNTLEDTSVPIYESYLEKGAKIPRGTLFQYWTETTITNKDKRRTKTNHTPSYGEVKNEGKKSERNPLQSGLVAMRRLYLKKLKDGSRLTLDGVDEVQTRYIPMLATKFRDNYNLVNYPCAVQPKLNGHRCIAYLDENEEVVLYSRQLHDIQGLEHIKKQIYSILKFGYGKGESLYLDGELYKHGMRLQDILSSSRNQKSTPTTDELVEYHIYDCFYPSAIGQPEWTFEQRWETLNGFAEEDMKLVIHEVAKDKIMEKFEKYKKLAPVDNPDEIKAISLKANKMQFSNIYKMRCADFVCLVPTVHCKDRFELEMNYSMFLADGYEGIIIRNYDATYDAGFKKSAEIRSQGLQKYKPIETDLYEIIGYTHGKNGREQSALIWVCKTKEGKEFNAVPKGMTVEARQNLFAEFVETPETFNKKYLGTMIEIEYEELSKTGVPQRAKALYVRDVL